MMSKIGHLDVLHTRVSINPSGWRDPVWCITVGNWWTAFINWYWAVRTGGTFNIIFEDEVVRRTSKVYDEDRGPWKENILSQLDHFGVKPSARQAFADADLKPEWQVVTEQDCKEAVEFAWRCLLPFRDRLVRVRDWPPPHQEGPYQVAPGLIEQQGAPRSVLHHVYRGLPLYMVAQRVVLDMYTGRNCFANGEECRRGFDLYNGIWDILNPHKSQPGQFTVPLLRYGYRKPNGIYGDEIISTSQCDPDKHPFFLYNLMDAGIGLKGLLGFLLPRVMAQPAANYTDIMPAHPLGILPMLRRYPVIDLEEWKRFLSAPAEQAAKVAELEQKRKRNRQYMREYRAKKRAEK